MLKHSPIIALVTTLIILGDTEDAGPARTRRRRTGGCRYGAAGGRNGPSGRGMTAPIDADEPAGDVRNEPADGRRKHDPTGHGQLRQSPRWRWHEPARELYQTGRR